MVLKRTKHKPQNRQTPFPAVKLCSCFSIVKWWMLGGRLASGNQLVLWLLNDVINDIYLSLKLSVLWRWDVVDWAVWLRWSEFQAYSDEEKLNGNIFEQYTRWGTGNIHHKVIEFVYETCIFVIDLITFYRRIIIVHHVAHHFAEWAFYLEEIKKNVTFRFDQS